MKFKSRSFIIFITILLIEIILALYIRDGFFRPFVGDILVILLVYYFIKAFTDIHTKLLWLYIFIFATLIEVGQYFNLLELLNLQNNRVLSVVLGSTFDLKDIFCYFIGSMIVFVIGNFERRGRHV